MNEKLDDILKQDVSALLDGELDELGFARVLAAHNNSELQLKLQRYSLLQSLLHSENVAVDAPSSNMVARVRSVIDKQPMVVDHTAAAQQPDVLSNSAPGVQWFKPALGFAMAASVAFLMVFNVDYWRTIGDNPASPTAFDPAVGAIIASSIEPRTHLTAQHISLAEQQLNDPYQVAVVADKELRRREELLLKANEENAEMQRRLRDYLIKHAQQNVSAPVNSVLPIARVSYTGYTE